MLSTPSPVPTFMALPSLTLKTVACCCAFPYIYIKDWFLEYALSQVVQAAKRHGAFLHRMFKHFAAEDGDRTNMSFAEFGDLIDSCVSDDMEKRKLHRQQ